MRDNAPEERILFSLFRSFVPIGIVSKARTTCCQVCRFRGGVFNALFFCGVVSRWAHLPFDPSCRNQDPHMRSHVVV